MRKRVLGFLLSLIAFAVAVGVQSPAQTANSDQGPRIVLAGQQYGYGQYPPGYSQSRLSPDDQRKFDHYYQKWSEASRKNDRDDIEENARRMQDIMAHYNIPASVPFSQIASGNNSYSNGTDGNPRNGGYGYPSNAQGRLSPDDQRRFDDYYQRWQDASRKNDRDDIESNARHMQDMMAHYNIPAGVPFDQIATSGNSNNGGYGYPGGGSYNSDGGYGSPAAAQSRLSADDQNRFDKYYEKWVHARRKDDRDDVDENARHMQDIMARYNIPANVPFDRIASARAGNH
jgi:hypothetical protein